MLSELKKNNKKRLRIVNEITKNNIILIKNESIFLESNQKNKEISKKYSSPPKFKISTPLHKFNQQSINNNRMTSTKEKTKESSTLKNSKKIFLHKNIKCEQKNMKYKPFSAISCFKSNLPPKKSIILKSLNITGKYSRNKNTNLNSSPIHNPICDSKIFLSEKLNKINLNKNSARQDNNNKKIKIYSNNSKRIKKFKLSSINTKIDKRKINPFYINSSNKKSSIIIKTERIFDELKNIKNQIAKSLGKNFKKIKSKKTNGTKYKIQDFTFRKNSKFIISNNHTIINKSNNKNNLKKFTKSVKSKIIGNKNISLNLLSIYSEEKIDNEEYETPHFSTLIE